MLLNLDFLLVSFNSPPPLLPLPRLLSRTAAPSLLPPASQPWIWRKRRDAGSGGGRGDPGAPTVDRSMRGDDELLWTWGSSEAGDPVGACGSKLQRSGPQAASRLASSSILPHLTHLDGYEACGHGGEVLRRRREPPGRERPHGSVPAEEKEGEETGHGDGMRTSMPSQSSHTSGARPQGGFCAAVFFRRSVPWKSDTSQVGLSLLSILTYQHCSRGSGLLASCVMCACLLVWQFLNYKSQFMHFLEG